MTIVAMTAEQSEAAAPFHDTSGVIATRSGTNYMDEVPEPVTLGRAGDDAAVPPATAVGSGGITIPEAIVFAIAAGCVWLFFRKRWHRFENAPGCPVAPGWSATASASLRLGLFVAAIVLAQIGAGVAIDALGLDLQPQLQPHEMVLVGLGRYAGEAIAIAGFVVLAVKERNASARRGVALGKAALKGAAALALFWPVLMTLVWLTNLIVRALTGSVPDAVAHQTLVLLLDSQPNAWALILAAMVVVLAPMVEEVLYRGMLQSALVRLEMPRWWAIAATSVVFVSMHIAAAPSAEALPGMLAALFVLSLGFGWIYEKTGSLLAPMVMHMLFNGGNLAAAAMLS